jgi:cyclic-di-AMP phosphodiesterase PgpH
MLRPPRIETTIRVPDILDMKESREILAAEIDDLELPERSRTLLKTLAGVFLSANITYNRLETEARRKRARDAVETVFYTIKRGKVIIRKGDEATPDAIKQIVLINRQIAGAPSWLANFSGTFLLTALLFVALWYYLKSLGRRREAFRNFLMMGLLLILSLLVSKMSLFLAGSFSERAGIAFLADARTYRFAFPLQFGTLIFAFLTTSQVALVYTILNSLMTGTCWAPSSTRCCSASSEAWRRFTA